MKKAVLGAAGAEIIDMNPEEVSEMEALQEAITEETEANAYKEKRAKEYPPIGDQLDAVLKIFHDLKEAGNELPHDLDSIITEWMSVKAKYPKPNNGNGGQGNGP